MSPPGPLAVCPPDTTLLGALLTSLVTRHMCEITSSDCTGQNCRATAPVAVSESPAGDAPTLQFHSHHLGFPDEEEETNKREKSGANHELDDGENEKKPIKKRRPPNPVGNYHQDRGRLHDRENKVDNVGIVPLIVIRQPAAGDEEAINPRRRDQVNNRVDDRFRFQTRNQIICVFR